MILVIAIMLLRILAGRCIYCNGRWDRGAQVCTSCGRC